MSGGIHNFTLYGLVWFCWIFADNGSLGLMSNDLDDLEAPLCNISIL